MRRARWLRGALWTAALLIAARVPPEIPADDWWIRAPGLALPAAITPQELRIRP